MLKTRIIYKILPAFVLLISGCSNFNGKEIRKQHATNYPLQLTQKTTEILDHNQPLNLDKCIQIAMDNSFSLKDAEIQERLSQLQKKVSFANFLPAVSLNYDKRWFDPQPMIKFGTSSIPMQDKDVREIT